MVLTEDLKKFLMSEFGIKLIRNAELYGKDMFKYGKKCYSIKDLLFHAKILNPKLFQDEKDV